MADTYIGGPDDVMDWARRQVGHRLGWRRAVLALHVQPDGRLSCSHEVGEQLLQLSPEEYASALALCDCRPEGVVVVASRPDHRTLVGATSLELFHDLEGELSEVGVRLLDLLVLDRHCWRSVAEEID